MTETQRLFRQLALRRELRHRHYRNVLTILKETLTYVLRSRTEH